jgi:dihydrofolate reductase
MKGQEGKDIALYGGPLLLTALLDLQLVDKLNMTIIPILPGEGRSMVQVLKQRAEI